MKQKCNEVADKCGVYVVYCPSDIVVRFKEGTDGLSQYKGRNLIAGIQILQEKWVLQSRILYIGKTGGSSNTLQRRIRQYVRYGYREVDNHRGGRYIWQIEDNKKLLIGYRALDGEDAGMYESKMSEQFEQHFGKLPFANLKH